MAVIGNEERFHPWSDQQITKYLEITDERRQTFHNELDKMHLNVNEYKWDRERVHLCCYQIHGKRFMVPIILRQRRPKKGEPVIWYVQTVMPCAPKVVKSYIGSWEHRKIWDQNCGSYKEKQLLNTNDGDSLFITETLTNPFLGGVVSRRQFTNVVHTKTIDPKTIELTACSTDIPEFPVRKHHTMAESKLYALRFTQIEADQLKADYAIPSLEVRNDKDEVEELKWTQLVGLMQTDLKGLLPKKIVEREIEATAGRTFEVCRLYALRNLLGLEVKVGKMQGTVCVFGD